MDLADLIPADGRPQTLYCDSCSGHLDLVFTHFHEMVSGVDIAIIGLPMLRCPDCNVDHMPDLTRLAIVDLHKRATDAGKPAMTVNRRKRERDFKFTEVPFDYDADDHFYIPGLFRQHDEGFLTPVFFNREVLLKYENSPVYRLQFASTTYGTIYTPDRYLSFGINKNDKVVMWLGDVGEMPTAEQYYLRSENVPSDHSIGGEFYDGQIECKYTALSVEDGLFKARGAFLEAFFRRYGKKVAQLDPEVMELALRFNGPIVDTDKERKHVSDTLNKIYLESLDNDALGELMKSAGLNPGSLRGLKRLQAVLSDTNPDEDIHLLLCPFYVLYDLRVAYLHLGRAGSEAATLLTVTERLDLPEGAGLLQTYGGLIERMTESFDALASILAASTAP